MMARMAKTPTLKRKQRQSSNNAIPIVVGSNSVITGNTTSSSNTNSGSTSKNHKKQRRIDGGVESTNGNSIADSSNVLTDAKSTVSTMATITATAIKLETTNISTTTTTNNSTSQTHNSSTNATTTNNNNTPHELTKAQFLKIFDEPEYQHNGVPNSLLKERFQTNYGDLVPVINELMSESRLSMSQSVKGELIYSVVDATLASKMIGLDTAARMVYQVIQKAGTMGIWTKIIRSQTSIEQQTLNKIFKILESRKLIKPVKSVTAKSKKLYMLYELVPAKELTGGVWYSDLEFDHEFINELRAFIVQCVRRLNDGKGITTKQILEKMIHAKVSKVELTLTEVQQIIETLIYDSMIEETTALGEYNNDVSTTTNGRGVGTDDTNNHQHQSTALYIAARRVTPMCEFKWWNSILSPDFKYRTIRFEDGVTISAQEQHYQT